MEKFLVTGGAGFIGSYYIRYMLDKHRGEINVTVLDALTYAGNPSKLTGLGTDGLGL